MFRPSTRLVSDVITAVRRKFGDVSGVQITDADIIRWINQGMVEIATKNKVLTATATTDVVADQTDYGFPSDDILSVEAVRVNGTFIPWKSYQEAQQSIDTETTSDYPEYWYEWGGVIKFWPLPAGDITNGLVVDYIKYPTLVTDTDDTLTIPDNYYNLLLNYVEMEAYELDEDWDAATNKSTEFQTNLGLTTGQEKRPSAAYYPTITVLEEDM